MNTTRYGRFVERQKKWSKRARRIYRHNRRSAPKTPTHHGGGKRWYFYTTGKQDPHGVKSGSFSGNKLALSPDFPPGAVYSGGGVDGWPHVKFTSPFYLATVAAGRHLAFPLLSYQVRRVRRIGRKVNRMNGEQRKIMGASWFAYNEGYYPSWDPLLRYPQLDGIFLDPGSSVAGIWPYAPVSPF